MTPTGDPGPITVDDLACLVQLGWAEPVGYTEDGTVTSYALTPAGRAVLQNQRARDPYAHEVTL